MRLRDVAWRCEFRYAVVGVGDILIDSFSQERHREEWAVEVPEFAGRVAVRSHSICDGADENLVGDWNVGLAGGC